MHQISSDRLSEVAANRAGDRFDGIGRSNDGAAAFHRIRAFYDEHDDRRADDVLHKPVIEWFPLVLGIMPLGASTIHDHQFHRGNRIAAPLEASDDFSDQAARNGVGLTKDKRLFDSHNARQGTGYRRPTPAARA